MWYFFHLWTYYCILVVLCFFSYPIPLTLQTRYSETILSSWKTVTLLSFYVEKLKNNIMINTGLFVVGVVTEVVHTLRLSVMLVWENLSFIFYFNKSSSLWIYSGLHYFSVKIKIYIGTMENMKSLYLLAAIHNICNITTKCKKFQINFLFLKLKKNYILKDKIIGHLQTVFAIYYNLYMT